MVEYNSAHAVCWPMNGALIYCENDERIENRKTKTKMNGIIVSHILASRTFVWSWRSNVLVQQTLMIRCLLE